MTWSPVAWPWRSLNCLKWSMSAITQTRPSPRWSASSNSRLACSKKARRFRQPVIGSRVASRPSSSLRSRRACCEVCRARLSWCSALTSRSRSMLPRTCPPGSSTGVHFTSTSRTCAGSSAGPMRTSRSSDGAAVRTAVAQGASTGSGPSPATARHSQSSCVTGWPMATARRGCCSGARRRKASLAIMTRACGSRITMPSSSTSKASRTRSGITWPGSRCCSTRRR